MGRISHWSRGFGSRRLHVRAGVAAAVLATAVLGLAVDGVSAAGAAAPELGRCVKAARFKEGTTTVYEGGYTTSHCLEASPTHTGRYEWEPGLAETGVTFAEKAQTGGPVFHSSGSSILVVCYGGMSGAGVVSGADELTGVTLRFTGCTEEVTGTPKCSTPGLAPGEVETSALVGRFGFLTHSPATVGLVLESLGSEPFSVIGCPRMTSVWGGLITKLKSDAMGSAQTLSYKDVHSRGQQQYQQFEGGPPSVLKLGSEEGRAVALEATVLLSFEEKAEINAVL